MLHGGMYEQNICRGRSAGDKPWEVKGLSIPAKLCDLVSIPFVGLVRVGYGIQTIQGGSSAFQGRSNLKRSTPDVHSKSAIGAD
jgi:hypothetical protein